jgi:type IVB pilus formation R64 PilN family outer membrane protein
MMRVKLLAAASALALVTACSGLPEKINGNIDAAQSKASQALLQVGKPDSGASAASTVVHENGMWIAKSPIKLAQADSLPPLFYEPATFDRAVGSLTEFAERITVRSGIPVKVAPDAATAAYRALATSTTTGGAQAGGLALPPGVPGQGAAAPAPTPNAGYNGYRTEVRIVYQSGNLKGLLDTAAARFGVYWKYDQGKVSFYYTDTRSFQIIAIPGDSALTATVSSGTNSTNGTGAAAGGATGSVAVGGGTTTNTQNTEMKSQLSVFSSLEKSIAAMLSAYGKVVASPATGSISVTDTPDILDRVAQFVEAENKTLSRQVMVNVTVLSVNTGGSDDYGINWSLVYGDLSRKYGVQNSFAGDPSSTSFSAAILNTATSKLAGSSLIINALSQQGRVRRETTASVVALNNQPVPVQVARQTSFLASSQNTVTANVGTSTSLTPGTVTSGFNMSILPRVLNNGTVMLQFSTDISSLRNIRQVSSGGSLIETPEIDTRNFLQRVAMKSGETLVISGFEQLDDDLKGQGVGKASNMILGGGYKASSNKESIVILITPITMGGA